MVILMRGMFLGPLLFTLLLGGTISLSLGACLLLGQIQMLGSVLTLLWSLEGINFVLQSSPFVFLDHAIIRLLCSSPIGCYINRTRHLLNLIVCQQIRYSFSSLLQIMNLSIVYVLSSLCYWRFLQCTYDFELLLQLHYSTWKQLQK